MGIVSSACGSLAVREAVLDSDARVGETIKWQSPTFTYKGNIAQHQPPEPEQGLPHVPPGARLPGKHPDLVGGSGTVKFLYFEDAKEVAAKRGAIRAAVRAWCAMVDEGA